MLQILAHSEIILDKFVFPECLIVTDSGEPSNHLILQQPKMVTPVYPQIINKFWSMPIGIEIIVNF